MTSVTFLFNGLRDKITLEGGANKSLASYFEAFCVKRGIDPRKLDVVMRSSNPRIGLAKVDLSLPFRLSGLSTSSVLEVQAKQQQQQQQQQTDADTSANDVRVLIESGRGERVQTSFPASIILADILSSLIRSEQIAGDLALILEKEFEGVSLVYLRSSISGKQLKTSTLESMGILSGSVKFRVSIPDSLMVPGYTQTTREATSEPAPVKAEASISTNMTHQTIMSTDVGIPPTPLNVADGAPFQPQADSSQLRPSVDANKLQPSVAAAQFQPSSSLTLAPSIQTRESTASVPVSISDIDAEDAAAARRVIRIRSTGRSVRASVAELRVAAFDADAREALETLIKMLDSLVSRPGDARVRSVRTSNPTFASRVGRFPSTLNILRAVGFKDKEQTSTDSSEPPVLTLQSSDEDDEITLGVREIIALEAHSLGAKFPPAPEPNVAHRERIAQVVEQTQLAFDPFKATVLKVEMDPATSVAKPAIKVLDGGGGLSRSTIGESSSSLLSSSSSSLPSSSSSSSSISSSSLLSLPTASSAAASSPLSPHMTEMERKVAGLKARAQELIALNAPMLSTPESRNTQITFYSPPPPVEADIMSQSRSLSSATSSSTVDDAAAMVDVPEERDPEAARLQLEFMRKRMRQAEKAKDGFHTKAMREAEVLQSAKVFTTAVVKVNFPDRTVVQGMFSPQEPVSALYAWLKDLLKEDNEGSGSSNNGEDTTMDSSSSSSLSTETPQKLPQFYLYQSPPPTQLAENDSRSLTDARLTPAALLHLGWGSKIGSSSANSGVGGGGGGIAGRKREDYFNKRAFELEAATREGVRELHYPSSVSVNDVSMTGAGTRGGGGGVDETEKMINAAANNLLGGGGGGGGSGKPSWLKLR